MQEGSRCKMTQSGGGKIITAFFYICKEKWSGSLATESIESGLESGDNQKKTEQQAEEDPAESVQDDASSALGFELYFHNDTLTAANKSQNISKTSNSDKSLLIASTERKNIK